MSFYSRIVEKRNPHLSKRGNVGTSLTLHPLTLSHRLLKLVFKKNGDVSDQSNGGYVVLGVSLR